MLNIPEEPKALIQAELAIEALIKLSNKKAASEFRQALFDQRISYFSREKIGLVLMKLQKAEVVDVLLIFMSDEVDRQISDNIFVAPPTINAEILYEKLSQLINTDFIKDKKNFLKNLTFRIFAPRNQINELLVKKILIELQSSNELKILHDVVLDKSVEWRIREMTLDVLVSGRSLQSLSVFYELLDMDEGIFFQRKIIEVLLEMQGDLAIPILMKFLDNGNCPDEKIIDILGNIQCEESIQVLLKIWFDGNCGSYIYEMIGKALSKMQNYELVNKFIDFLIENFLDKEIDPYNKWEICEMLCQMQVIEAIPVIYEFMYSQYNLIYKKPFAKVNLDSGKQQETLLPPMKFDCFDQLLKIKSPKIIPFLINILQDNMVDVRQKQMIALELSKRSISIGIFHLLYFWDEYWFNFDDEAINILSENSVLKEEHIFFIQEMLGESRNSKIELGKVLFEIGKREKIPIASHISNK